MLLTTTAITKTFSGIHALTKVGLDVDDGGRGGLSGPNGAGQTPVFK